MQNSNIEFHYLDYPDCSLLDMICAEDNGIYYEIPVNTNDLIGLLSVGVHHSSALMAKLNILKSTFQETPYLSSLEFEKLAYNYLVLGNAYLEAQRNRFKKIVGFKSRLARFMRRSSNLRDYIYLRAPSFNQQHYEKIKGEDIAHILQPDLRQEIYGVPYYLAALNSIQLNASATRFRRRYYDNGSHAGFILYSTDTNLDEGDWDNLKNQLRSSKNNGNFKNVFLRSPQGDPESLKLIPISEVAAKDEFLNIKNVSADDMLVIHRVPPKLMGIVPKSAGSLGDARTDAEVFATNEIIPLQQQFLSVNEKFKLEVFKFKPYQIGKIE